MHDVTSQLIYTSWHKVHSIDIGIDIGDFIISLLKPHLEQLH